MFIGILIDSMQTSVVDGSPVKIAAGVAVEKSPGAAAPALTVARGSLIVLIEDGSQQRSAPAGDYVCRPPGALYMAIQSRVFSKAAATR
jgi:hypothetical protein